VNRKREFGLDSAAAVHELHLTGPNTRDGRDNIAFFAFHTFLVEVHSNEAKIESGPNYTSGNHRLEMMQLREGTGEEVFFILEKSPHFTAIFPTGRANSSDSVDKLMINHLVQLLSTKKSSNCSNW